MRTIIFFILFSGLLTSTTVAQENQEVYPQQASIEHNQAVKDFSREYFSAMGNNSSFNLQQLSDGTSYALVNMEGSKNNAYLSQNGYGITGLMDISGSDNQSSMYQSGANLQSILEIEGHANQFNMMQTGNNIQNHFQIYSSGTNFEVQQNNSGMQFRQSGTGSIPLSIQQTGSSRPIIIQNN